MDKFWNLMYDFFVFALPGAFVISAFLLPYDFYNRVYELVNRINELEFSFLLILTVAGYIVGYLITPIARLKLLLWVLFFKKIKKEKDELYEKLKNSNQPKTFIQIRDKSVINHKYIEFWNMHLTMAHNLALASFVFYIIQLYKACNAGADTLYYVWTSVICVFSVIVFMCVSIKFSRWWVGDIMAMEEKFSKR